MAARLIVLPGSGCVTEEPGQLSNLAQIRCPTQLAHMNATMAGESGGVGHRASERGSQAGVFLATHWSVVLAAKPPASPGASAALEKLCRTYWYPLDIFARRQGLTPEDAEDLVQEFFARLLQKDFLRAVEPERGRFRTFQVMARRNHHHGIDCVAAPFHLLPARRPFRAGTPVSDPSIRTGGASRAAEVLSALLEQKLSKHCSPETEDRRPVPPMPTQLPKRVAFTLIELLVVITIIGILAALLFPSLSKAKAAARRIECLNNLRQVSLGVLIYCDDFAQILPGRSPAPPGVHGWYAFKSLTKSYVGLTGLSSPRDRPYSCPADTFFYNDGIDQGGPFFYSKRMHEQPWSDYSSFLLNCGNLVTNAFYRGSRCQFPGVGEEKLSALRDPSRTVLLAEDPALVPYSWHEPRWRLRSNYPFNDAHCMASFTDGHAKYLRFYWDETLASGVESWYYDPPGNYEYRWSAR